MRSTAKMFHLTRDGLEWLGGALGIKIYDEI